LQEIELEKATEHLDRLSKDAELQKYAKQRRSSRSPANASESEAKGPRLRTAQDVLDRVKHDPSLSTSEYVIGYLERFDGIKEMPVSNWIRESTDEDFIPQHRIRWIKRRQLAGEDAVEDVVWSRDERIDKIFGSRSGTGDCER
jgi:uncharacterized protein (UPF0248 family)